MKSIFILLTAALFAHFPNGDVKDWLGAPGPLVFEKTSFNLAWSSKPSDSYYMQEYVPKGENVERFNQMLILNVLVGDIGVKEAVGQKTAELENRKKTDPTCNYQVIESPDGKEFIIDFLLGESKVDKMTVIEFNVYKYKQINLGKKGKALVLYSYSKRSYGEGITPFLKNLKDERPKHLNAMISATIPAISIKDK